MSVINEKNSKTASVLQVGSLVIDTQNQSVTFDGASQMGFHRGVKQTNIYVHVSKSRKDVGVSNIFAFARLQSSDYAVV